MLKGKLRSRRGETLTEVLVAILVTALSILILTSAVATAMRFNAQARQMDTGPDGNGGFYGALTKVETLSADAEKIEAVNLKVTGGPSDVPLDNVKCYTQNALIAYGRGG